MRVPIRARLALRVVTVLGTLACLGDAGSATEGGNGMKPLSASQLRCEYLTDPVGIDETRPRLSWLVTGEGRARRQSAYRIIVASTRDRAERGTGDLWDTGKAEGDVTQVAYAGQPLSSRRQCFWRVRCWDEAGRESRWSAVASWSMGLLQPSDWQAEWISFRDPSPVHTRRDTLHLPAPRRYRTSFQVTGEVRRAVIYLSALGIYRLRVNGRLADDAYFAPGWSDYRRRAYYRAVDITRFVTPGENVAAVTLADGWYSGYVGYGLLVGYGPHKTGRAFYGKTPALLAQVEVELEKGETQLFATGRGWRSSPDHPVLHADFLMGEAYDARREQAGWDAPGYDDSSWEPAVRAKENGRFPAPYSDRAGEREVDLGFVPPARLQAYPGPPIRATAELPARRLTQPQAGVYIFDLGQNIAGCARLHVRGPAGTRVRLRFGEMLHPDGTLMTENLRRARATDEYVLRGDPAGETWSPEFTYHGFQYVEVTGWPAGSGRPRLDAVTGIAVHSDTPLTSSFRCSDPVVNRLFENVVWTQRGNFVEVPTDCPQRDERLGWMGDAQIYVGTAALNADVASFYTKWLDDVEESQLPNGAYPDYAPYPMFHGPTPDGYGTAWTDAGVICPHAIWRAYGDTRIIERHWDSMLRFIRFREARDPMRVGVNAGNGWGDWLSLGTPTPIEYVDLCYFARSAQLMAEMARATGKSDAERLGRLWEEIRASFQRTQLRPDGLLKVDTQTAYCLALKFDLLPEADRHRAATALAGLIQANGGRMATGFLGTQPLLPVLSRYGQHDMAVRLLQSREYPSWGYEVVNGATSIWERWNSYTKEGGFHNPSMNSFSHYSFGAVCEWMFRSLAGIDWEDPGCARFLIRPGPPGRKSNPLLSPIEQVSASYRSIRGEVAVNWRRHAGRFELALTVPANTTAIVALPGVDPALTREGGRPLQAAAGVRFLRIEGDRTLLEVGSGAYRFECPVPE